MDLFEFEGKALLRQYGIPVPNSQLITQEDAPEPMAYPFVLKAQVLTGGRGKAGGVKVCHDDDEYRQYTHNILHMEINGHKVPCRVFPSQPLFSAAREAWILRPLPPLHPIRSAR